MLHNLVVNLITVTLNTLHSTTHKRNVWNRTSTAGTGWVPPYIWIPPSAPASRTQLETHRQKTSMIRGSLFCIKHNIKNI